MTSVEIPLVQGWNLIAYPVRATRPVSAALRSIDDAYLLVYGHEPTDPNDPNTLHCQRDCDAMHYGDYRPLTALEFGRGYWIYVDRPITLYLKGGECDSESDNDE